MPPLLLADDLEHVREALAADMEFAHLYLARGVIASGEKLSRSNAGVGRAR